MTPRELSSKISSLPNRTPHAAELNVALEKIGTKDPIASADSNPKNSWLRCLEGYKGQSTRSPEGIEPHSKICL
jgi:hypothetical protein